MQLARTLFAQSCTSLPHTASSCILTQPLISCEHSSYYYPHLLFTYWHHTLLPLFDSALASCIISCVHEVLRPPLVMSCLLAV
jgi:hypothetical protein